jgi:hypothetical protein
MRLGRVVPFLVPVPSIPYFRSDPRNALNVQPSASAPSSEYVAVGMTSRRRTHPVVTGRQSAACDNSSSETVGMSSGPEDSNETGHYSRDNGYFK